jgi:hypothetical protein
MAMVQLRVLGGAVARVPADATAYAHRDQPLMASVMAGWAEGDDPRPVLAWAGGTWEHLRGASTGAYVNFLEDEGDARIREAYPGATYERLARVKRAYDPHDRFRLTQHIAPVA